jgi:polyphosphate kinase 2 (PPK2 family)
MDYREKLVVEPGSPIWLSEIDASYTGKHERQEQALPEIQVHLKRMGELQYLLYADNDQSLLAVLQEPHAAGKDGVIRFVQRDEPARNIRLRSQRAEQNRGCPRLPLAGAPAHVRQR